MRPLENSRDLNITRLYNVTIANFWAAWSDETQKDNGGDPEDFQSRPSRWIFARAEIGITPCMLQMVKTSPMQRLS